MRIMNPYLVETFVETTGSHHDVTDDFGNTDGVVSTVLKPLNTTWKHVKAKTPSESNEKIKSMINHDEIGKISDENGLRDKLIVLGSRLTNKSSEPECVDWAFRNSITLRNEKTVGEWWKSLKYPSRLACYNYVNSKQFKKY